MNRIAEIAPDALTPEQTKIFDQLTAGRGRILAPYKVWIHSPTLASGMEHIGTFLNKRSSLSAREVEIGILIIANHWQGDYVVAAHIREGKKVGLTQDGKVVGRFKATGVRPKVCERLKACGVHLPGDMFEGVTEVR